MALTLENIAIPAAQASKRTIGSVLAAKRRIFDEFAANPRYKTFVENGDVYGCYDAVQKDLKKSKGKRGNIIAGFAKFVERTLTYKFGVKTLFENEKANSVSTCAEYFKDHQAKPYLVLYETFAKYNALVAQANPPLNKKFIYQNLPSFLTINDDICLKNGNPADYLGHGINQIRLDTGLFKSNPAEKLKISLEHEIGHFYEEKHAGSTHPDSHNYVPHCFLNLLTPEERQPVELLSKILVKNYDQISEKLSAAGKYVDKEALCFPVQYSAKDQTLLNLKRFTEDIKPAVPIINKLGEEYDEKNLFRKFMKSAKILIRFARGFDGIINDNPYFIADPSEVKAQSFAVRAGVNGFQTEKTILGTTVKLPIPELFEEQLVKLGMPPPMTYTVLPEDYFAKKTHAKI